jgi:L-histidine Nalpha-methyltransferase
MNAPLALTITNPLRQPDFVQQYVHNASAVRDELAAGLLAAQASTAPKYFYNALGSSLFEAITQLDEYYPTRTEGALFQLHRQEIAQAAHESVGKGCTLIDLGAGNCAKAASLFNALAPSQYVAVDISADFLREALVNLQQQHPALPMLGLGTDFSSSLDLPAQVQAQQRLFFYPGSSIGNFTPDAALAFLQRIRASIGVSKGGLLIGVDNVKDSATLQAAYDDALGVTGAFNLNALLNINALLNADFNVRQWQHVALYSTEQSRIEMYLQAREALTVRWPGAERQFAAGERIHTENSCKYTPDAFSSLLTQAGFGTVRHWTDAQGWFSVFLAV